MALPFKSWSIFNILNWKYTVISMVKPKRILHSCKKCFYSGLHMTLLEGRVTKLLAPFQVHHNVSLPWRTESIKASAQLSSQVPRRAHWSPLNYIITIHLSETYINNTHSSNWGYRLTWHNNVQYQFPVEICIITRWASFESNLKSLETLEKFGYIPFSVIPEVTLSLGSSLTLWSLFHPQFECIRKLIEIGVSVQKICRILFWQGFWFNEEYEQKVQARQIWKWGGTSLEQIKVRKLVWSPTFVFFSVLFSSWLLMSSPVLMKLESSLGY
jgi:hypothetical protein